MNREQLNKIEWIEFLISKKSFGIEHIKLEIQRYERRTILDKSELEKMDQELVKLKWDLEESNNE